ncbi:MAG: sigma-70 family RNA polymerase sigma factor [Pyrinomonadaceae bacterium]|nr:sigma-70 family RNA polymerase sigma factor [Pyrinomonadaceae bacterium]
MLVADAQTDVILLPFLRATDEREEAGQLNRLIAEHLEPTIRQVVRRKLHAYTPRGEIKFKNPDVEEVYNEILLKLIKRLRELKGGSGGKPINNLRSYMAAVAQNTCDEYLRRKHPQRYYLKNKVRHYLTEHGEFALWKDTEGAWLAGLSVWDGKKADCRTDYELSGAVEAQETWTSRLQSLKAHRLEMGELLNFIFQASGKPLELDELVSVIARLWVLEDLPAESFDEGENPLSEQLASAQAGPETVAEYQELLRLLWHEICQLPRRQQVALLFNLRNPYGVNVITLFPATGIATFEQIAETLGIPAEQFEETWARLPMDDLSIAAYLGATRQQVINLRKNARDRLLRRMQAFSRKPPR